MPGHDNTAAGRPIGARAPETTGPDGWGLGPLDSADAAFRALTTGPDPLALNPARLAPGLPDRHVPLDELKALLLHPATSAASRNKVWAELVRRPDSRASVGDRFDRHRHARLAPRGRHLRPGLPW